MGTLHRGWSFSGTPGATAPDDTRGWIPDIMESAKRVMGSDESVKLCESGKTAESEDIFVRKYRTLPFRVRAKLENWEIDSKELIVQKSSGDGTRAIFHGLDVDIRVVSQQERTTTFPNEVNALAQLRHPNILSFLGICHMHSEIFIVTEVVNPSNLETYILSNRNSNPTWKPSRTKVVEWSLDLFRAVNYMHGCNPAVVHRNISPANILMTLSGTLKLTGFGTCRFLDSSVQPCFLAVEKVDFEVSDCRSSQSSVRSLGSWPSFSLDEVDPLRCYSAPELSRDAECNHPTLDIFSCGMVISFMFCARHPDADPASSASTPPSTPTTRSPKLIPLSFPLRLSTAGWPKLTSIIDRCCARDPASRPAVQAVVRDLEDLSGSHGKDRSLHRRFSLLCLTPRSVDVDDC